MCPFTPHVVIVFVVFVAVFVVIPVRVLVLDFGIAMVGVGAANVAAFRLLVHAGVDPGGIVACDSRGVLHPGRGDIEAARREYADKWRICETSNAERITGGIAEAMRGADVVVAHVGTTVGGAIGVKDAACSLDEATERTQAIVTAAREERDDVLCLTHGGPIATPDDAAYVLQRCDAVGFVGASSLERLAFEDSLVPLTQRFKQLSAGPGAKSAS